MSATGTKRYAPSGKTTKTRAFHVFPTLAGNVCFQTENGQAMLDNLPIDILIRTNDLLVYYVPRKDQTMVHTNTQHLNVCGKFEVRTEAARRAALECAVPLPKALRGLVQAFATAGYALQNENHVWELCAPFLLYSVSRAKRERTTRADENLASIRALVA